VRDVRAVEYCVVLHNIVSYQVKRRCVGVGLSCTVLYCT